MKTSNIGRVVRRGLARIGPETGRRLPACSACGCLLLMLLLAPAGADVAVADIVVKVRPDGTRVMVNTGDPARPAGGDTSRASGGSQGKLTPAQLDARADRHRRYRLERARFEALIDRYSERQGLDPRLVRAVVQVESSYRPEARSHKGAMGLMQLMPETAAELAVHDPYDPDQNLRGGIAYLAAQLERFGGRKELALAAYNAGPTAVERYDGVPPYRETREYVEKVLSLYEGRRVALPSSPAPRPGRKPFIVRDAEGGIVLTTDPSD